MLGSFHNESARITESACFHVKCDSTHAKKTTTTKSSTYDKCSHVNHVNNSDRTVFEE